MEQRECEWQQKKRLPFRKALRSPLLELSTFVSIYGISSSSIVVDIIQEKLDFALSFCATHTFLPSRPKEGETPPQAAERNARELFKTIGGDVLEKDGVDLVMECTGK